MLQLILIRHGETEANRELRFQGHADFALNAMGVLQSQRLGQALDQAGILARVQATYSSDLQRAVQTAQIAWSAAGTDPQLQLFPALREQCFGTLEGLTFAQASQHHPEVVQRWMDFDPDYVVPQGESTRQFHQRVMQVLGAIAARHAQPVMSSGEPETSVLVFTHGGVLDMVWRTLSGQTLAGPRRSEIPNTGINRMRWDGHTFHLLDWADAQHVTDLPAQPRYDQQKLAKPLHE